MSFSDKTVIRINLAWVENLVSLEDVINSFNNEIYLDLPLGRTKPPNNSYSIDDLKKIIDKHDNIRYLAISNVESAEHLIPYINLFGQVLTIVPKIETKKGIDNISSICSTLINDKFIMLDHDDLFSDLIRLKIPSTEFFTYIEKLSDYCDSNSVKLLKTRGVIFSDEDEYKYGK